MKKSIVAGAASLVLAAMPVVGVFATDIREAVDTLTVTVNESCTFERTTGEANITKGMAAGALDPSFGTNVFKAACNNGKGYDINAVFTALTHQGSAGQAIDYSATTPTENSGTWTAAIDGTSNIAASEGKLGTRTSQDPAGGSTYSVTYKVSLHSDQAQGTYKGTATYTLVQKTGA